MTAIQQLYPVYQEHLLVFLLVLTRVSGLVIAAPLLSSRSAPLRVRAFLAIALAMIIAPLQWGTLSDVPRSLVGMVVLLAAEFVVGLSVGLAMTILLSGVQVTGQLVSQISGLQLADVFDPTFETNVPVFSQLLDLIALAVFVSFGGQRQVLGALLDSFQWSPAGRSFPSEQLFQVAIDLVTQSFVIGIRIAAPVMVALLLAILILALISRTLPQLNVLGLGFSLNSMVTMATLAATLGTLGWIFQEYVDAAFDSLRSALVASPPT